MKTTTNKFIIALVMKQDYWRGVTIDGIRYFRTFEDNVVYFKG